MSFLTPLFFLGLAALAVPVLIHLTQRERKTVVRFPSLMFLKKIPYESVRRRRIRDWLLLMLRLSALALIVLAFARPFVRGSELAAATGAAREVVVLLDRSYSMGFGDTWTRAQRAAAQAIGDVTSADRVSLVLFSSGAEVALRSSPDRARVVAAIEAATPGPGATRYGPALKLAGSLLAESLLPRREVILVSDFQRGGWQPDDTLRLPGGATLTPVVVESGEGANLALAPVSFSRVPSEGQDRVVVTAGVMNRGATAAMDVSVQLELDGRVVQTVRLTVAPNAAASTTFSPVAIPSPGTRAAVRIAAAAEPQGAAAQSVPQQPDALVRDNVFYFVLSPPAPVPVTIVGSGGQANASLYLVRALSIGDEPRFETTLQAPDALAADLGTRSRLLVLNDVAVGETMAAHLMTFVEGGGGLLMALGPRSSWPEAKAAWLPVSVAGTIDRTRGAAARLSAIDYGHAVFEPFRGPRGGDFASARFYNYRAMTATKDASVLARFDAGEPALVEQAVGRGHIVVLASTLDLSWNDLPLKPVFLPFVHQVARHLASYREQTPWLTVGQVLDIGAAEAAAGANRGASPRTVLAPSGQRRDLSVSSAPSATSESVSSAPSAAPSRQAEVSASSASSAALELTEQGFYEIRGAGRDAGPVIVAAANVELAESNLERMDPKELVAAVSGVGTAGPSGGQDVLPDEAQELAQRVWWYLLFAGILLLIAETVLAGRLSRAAR